MTNPALYSAVETVFGRVTHAIAGETFEVGLHVAVQMVAAMAAVQCDTMEEAADLVASVASAATAAMVANFDHYRETAENVGVRQ